MQVSNDGIDPKLFEHVVDMMGRAPVYQNLGIKLSRLGKGTCELKMQVDEKHCIAEGQIHGGMYLTLSDAAMGLAMQSLGIEGATVEMSSQFIYPVRQGQLIIARAQVVKSGKRVLFIEAEALSEEKLIFHCHGAFVNKGPLNIP